MMAGRHFRSGRRALWERTTMAHVGSSIGGRDVECDGLLHPELLSRDFLLLSLGKKNIEVKEVSNDKERLTEIFVQHAMPLPQRQLPKSRWGKIMEDKREQKKVTEPQRKSVNVESGRKRPLIVFDGHSTSTTIKVKRKENGETAQQLHPTQTERTSTSSQKPGASPASPQHYVCSSKINREAKFSSDNNHDHPESTAPPGNATHCIKTEQPAVKIKRAAPKDEADMMGDLKPTEAKKKVIPRVTWP
uniref:Ashwin n=1 Tax=Leptobrachium leishanense TaxID=445787 RepID=A0A8C5MWF4_9ANUR